MNTKPLRIGVLFGGRSVEHEISIISALQAIKALNTEKYIPVPIYIDPTGRWWCGDPLFDKSTYLNFSSMQAQLTEVTLLPKPPARGLTILNRPNKSPLEKARSIFCVDNDLIPIDVYLLAFHGEFGEDGSIQGLLELSDSTFSGCSVLASSVAMDKPLCKACLKSNDIPVLPHMLIKKRDAQQHFLEQVDSIVENAELGGFPLFVKPAHLGSSIGIGKASDKEELKQRLAKVFCHDSVAMIEPCLEDMFEINISVLDGSPPIASVIEVPHASEETLSFEDKYLRGGKKKGGDGSSDGMAALPRSINPDNVPETMKNTVIEYALKAYDILNASGLVRFDFMIDSKSNTIYFNELNPIPGSLSFYLWIESEPRRLYTENLDSLIQSAIKRKSEQLSLEKNIEFRALR